MRELFVFKRQSNVYEKSERIAKDHKAILNVCFQLKKFFFYTICKKALFLVIFPKKKFLFLK